MEIIETTIVDQGNHRIWELRGDGGESVKVILTVRPAEAGEEFTARAKAILVQAAAFQQAPATGPTDHPQPERFVLEYLDKGGARHARIREAPRADPPHEEATSEEQRERAEEASRDREAHAEPG